ncbi:MAG: sulfatase [Bacteroidota bacterium]|nr:sulfatase [Bacteroidota bacterium]
MPACRQLLLFQPRTETPGAHWHVCAALIALLLTGCVPERPLNIVLIVTDDQGWADLGSYGARDLDTPNLDRLAAEGIRFTNYYASNAACSPSRAALLTGMYPMRVGLPGVLMPQSNAGLNPAERTLAEMLRDLGYRTAAIGKWHLGHHPEHLPVNHGFESYFGIPYSNDMTPDSTKNPNPYARNHPPLPLVENDRTIEVEPDQRLLTRRYTERATTFIETHRDEPFFLYMAHTFPHMPLFVSDDFAGQSRRGLYGDVIMEIDASTGTIMDALERHNLTHHTLIIFTSDNGPWLVKAPFAGSAGPFREGKGTTFEGGHRVPLILRWPARIPAGQVSDAMVLAMDLMPTIAALTEAPPGPYPFDGKDLMPTIDGGPTPHEAFFYYRGRALEAVRSGPWKLHVPHLFRSIHGATLVTPTHPGTYRQDSTDLALYDLAADPGETRNLAGDHPDVVDHLLTLMETARQDLGDSRTGVQGSNIRASARVTH